MIVLDAEEKENKNENLIEAKAKIILV